LLAATPPVVNYAQAAAFSLVAPAIREPYFPQATCYGNQITRRGILQQHLLKPMKCLIVKIVLTKALKRWQFNKDGLHGTYYTQIA
jgi:hypothetical protein